MKIFRFILLLMGFGTLNAQDAKVQSTAFNNKISSLLSFSVPVISVTDLHRMRADEDLILLDARGKDEFEVSHIPDARYVGYDDFDLGTLDGIEKNKKLVIYCSIGYRSEKIAEKLEKAGFTQVFNLYGSIFEWVNSGFELVNKEGDATNKIHTYNRSWSKWMVNDDYEKVY